MSSEIDLVNLLNPSSAQLEALTDKVRQTKGFLPVLTHPFFTEHRPDTSIRHAYTSPEYRQSRDNFLSGALKRDYPILILQNYNDRDLLKPDLQRLGSGAVYYMLTYPAGPEPVVDLSQLTNYGKSKGPEIDKIESDLAWEALFIPLRQVGVEKISMGGIYLCNYTSEVAWYVAYSDQMRTIRDNRGQYLSLFPLAASWLSQDIMPTGCAGAAARRFLIGGFDVALSRISTPCKGNEIIPMNLVEDDNP